jgi:hypothetical protein
MTRAVSTLALAAWLAAAGCDYFRPADPEPPGGAAIPADYSDPDATLRTMALAIGDKARTNGASAYAGAFADGFQHQFWPDDVQSWESSSGRPAPVWNLQLERNFYTLFVGLRGDNYLLEWLPDETRPDPPEDLAQATIHRHYLITTETEDNVPTGFLAIGYADLTFVKSAQGEWLITRWEDRLDPGADPNEPEQVTLGLRRLGTQ